jgi:hypothetical protein
MPSENFTPNNVWGSNTPEGAEEELVLPSGQNCRARRVTIESMIEAGILSQVDSLTALVDQYTRKVKGGSRVADGTPVLDQKILGDTEALKLMITMADRALPSIVVSPPVALHFQERTVGKTRVTRKLSEEDREKLRQETPGLIFTDQIDLEDKMELFEWGVGGLKAFSSFRRDGSSDDVGGVVARKGPASKAKRNPRSR